MTQRAQLATLFLTSLFVGLIILLWGVGHLVIQIIAGAPITLNINDVAYPLNLGEISLGTVLFSASLLTLILFHELNGFRQSVGLCLASSVGIFLIWGFILLLPGIPYLVGAADMGALPSMAFDLSLGHIIKIQSYLLSLLCVSFFYSLFRWLFKNGFYIVRYFLSHVIGLGVAAITHSFIENPASDTYGLLLAGGLVFYAHTLGLFLIYFPLHYFIKWPLMIFAGSQHRTYLKTHYSRQKKNAVTQPVQTQAMEPKPVYFTSSQNIESLPNPFSKEDSVSISRQNI